MNSGEDIGEHAGCVELILFDFLFANANVKTLMEQREQTHTFAAW